MTYSRKEAAVMLGISLSTLKRKMASGEIQFSRHGEGQFSEVFFTAQQLGINEAVNHSPAPGTPTHKPVPDISEPGAFVPQEMTEDSIGNSIHGSKRTYSLLGPNPPIEYTPAPGTTDHMDAALLGTSTANRGTDGAPILHAGSDNHPLNKDFKGIPTTKKPPHPNANRQAFLDAIFRDVGRGWAR